MKNSSVLSCEHIHIRRIPGRTDAFITALKDYLRTLPAPGDGLDWVEIRIDQKPDDAENLENSACVNQALEKLDQLDEFDVRVNMCCELFRMDDAQAALSGMLGSGQLKDCVRYCALLQDETTASLTLSGLYRGAFLHGAVPFTGDNEDILVACGWNGLTHRAEFSLPESAADQVADLVDALESRLEIDLEFAPDGRSLKIESLQLAGHDDVLFYRDTLAQLTGMSDRAQITGALVPDSDAVFALLRFVPAGAGILIQTAVAEY